MISASLLAFKCLKTLSSLLSVWQLEEQLALELAAEAERAAQAAARKPPPKTKVSRKEAAKAARKSASKGSEANSPVKESSAKLAASVKVPANEAPVKDDRVPNGMVRITHNPLTNSAVITPLYGPLEPTPSYLQQPIPHSISSQTLQNSPVNYRLPSPVNASPPAPTANPTSSATCNTTTNSLSNPTTPSGQPQQMVTIRRVMQPNLSEPVVTVTLKGESPANDRVLFTLVNGQVLPTDGKASSPPGTAPTAAKAKAATGMTKKKLKKKEKKKEKREEKLRLLNQDAAAVASSSSCSSSSNSGVFQPILRPPVINLVVRRS